MKKQLHNENDTNLHRFLLLWASQGVSELGSSMTSFGLVLWAYSQKGTAMSTVSMAFFSYLPYVLISFAAGTLADRWKKKNIMLVCDTIAAMCSAAVLLLLYLGELQVWYLYGINLLIGCMNAFQQPASMVAVTLLTPKKYYPNISGMQAFSNSLVAMATPALATALVSLGGLTTVLLLDLTSFALAFLTLALGIPIPEPLKKNCQKQEGFWQQCREGIRYLSGQKAVWSMILFFALVNLLASMAGNSLMPAMILSRTGNDQKALGAVSSCLGAGTLIGSIFATLAPRPKSRRRVIFLSCGFSFLFCDVLWAVGASTWVWMLAALLGNLPLPLLNASMSSVLREKIPIDMQGRAFSTQATFQFFTIPVGYLLGGVLADYVFEPFMGRQGEFQQLLSLAVGSGKGAGMALIFLITGIVGLMINLTALGNPVFKELDI